MVQASGGFLVIFDAGKPTDVRAVVSVAGSLQNRLSDDDHEVAEPRDDQVDLIRGESLVRIDRGFETLGKFEVTLSSWMH